LAPSCTYSSWVDVRYAHHAIGSVIAKTAPRIKSSYRIETIGTITKEGI